MIVSSIPWRLTINRHSIQKPEIFESILASNRKLRHVCVVDDLDPVTTQRMLEVFRKHGTNVHQITFHSCECSYNVCNHLLRWTPNLEQAKIVSFKPIKSSGDIGGNLPAFNKLKRLTIRKFGWLKIFMNCKVEALEIQEHVHSVETIELLLQFLSTQDKLTSLGLPNRNEIFNALVAVPFPFKLGKISLSNILDVKNSSSVASFLESHSETLEELKLKNHFPVIIFEVFSKLKKLRTLRLDYCDLPEVFECSPISESITTLDFSHLDTSKARNFFSRLPNAKNLLLPWGELRNIHPDVMKVVASNLQNLKYLGWAGFKRDVCNDLKFQSLESLKIRYLHTIDWETFNKKNPGSVRNFILEVFRYPIDIYKVQQSLALLALTIEDPNMKYDREFFNAIYKECPKLRSKCIYRDYLEQPESELKDYDSEYKYKFMRTILL